jgi:hypothetical protein
VNVTVSPPQSATMSPHFSKPNSAPTSPVVSYTPRQSRPMPGMYRDDHNASVDSFQSVGSQDSGGSASGSAGGSYAGYTTGPAMHPSRLAREKNRLTLRSYLHTLLSSSVFASSPVLRSFLLSGPTHLKYAPGFVYGIQANRIRSLVMRSRKTHGGEKRQTACARTGE